MWDPDEVAIVAVNVSLPPTRVPPMSILSRWHISCVSSIWACFHTEFYDIFWYHSVFSFHGQFEFGTWFAAGRAMDPSMRPEPVPMRAARRFQRSVWIGLPYQQGLESLEWQDVRTFPTLFTATCTCLNHVWHLICWACLASYGHSKSMHIIATYFLDCTCMLLL